MTEAAHAGLWCVSFTAPPDAAPELLDRLEPLGLGATLVEDEADAEARTTRWRVELLLSARPDRVRLARKLRALCAPWGFEPRPLAIERVAPTDWLAATVRQAVPVRVGRFFVHGSAARADVPTGLLAIEVEAGLAFGSGEHETTQACLLAIDRLRGRRPRRILDLGCGSAVLGMAAARRWPGARLTFVDNDASAVQVAAGNLALNGVAGGALALVGDGWSAPALRRRGPFDLVLANILADPLTAMAGALARNLAPGGKAILSGFVQRDVARVAAAHRRHGLRVRGRIDRRPWSALMVAAPP